MLKKKKEFMQAQKGITLIALIITIIVMLILAGVTISIVVNGGLFKQAQNASDQTIDATVEEEALMISATAKIDKVSDVDNTKTFTEILKDSASGTDFELGENGLITNKQYGNQYIVKNDFSLIKIPKGFTYEEGTADTGIVIKDNVGNEFVWVPCTMDGADGTLKYEKWTMSGYAWNDASLSNDALPIGISDETDQIRAKEGFYIARYGAGLTSDINQTTADKATRDVSRHAVKQKR